MVCRIPFPDVLRWVEEVHWRILVEVVKDIVHDAFLAFDSISFLISVGVGIVVYLVLIRR